MRTVISMKKINSYYWAPLNIRLKTEWTPYTPDVELDMFYYVLARVVSILDEDNCFYEDD
jgi:hypothetical protein